MTKNPIAIIAFTGPAGSGKDTAGRYLIDNYGFKKLSFAKGLKDMLAVLGYPDPASAADKEAIIPELGVSWRHLAQTLGTEWGRQQVHPDLWVIIAEQVIRKEAGAFVITDLRFENEAAMVRRLGGVIGFLTGRAYEMPDTTAKHASEAGIEFQDGLGNLPGGHDFKIDNSLPLQALYGQVDQLARYVGAEREATTTAAPVEPVTTLDDLKHDDSAPVPVEMPAEQGAAEGPTE